MFKLNKRSRSMEKDYPQIPNSNLSTFPPQWWQSMTMLGTRKTSFHSKRAPSFTWSRRTMTAGTRGWWTAQRGSSLETTWNPSCTTLTELPPNHLRGACDGKGLGEEKSQDFDQVAYDQLCLKRRGRRRKVTTRRTEKSSLNSRSSLYCKTTTILSISFPFIFLFFMWLRTGKGDGMFLYSESFELHYQTATFIFVSFRYI